MICIFWLYRCEVCGKKFPFQDDFRQHRIRHFDSEGKLTRAGVRLWKVRHPDQSPNITLHDLEQNPLEKEEALIANQQTDQLTEQSDGQQETIPASSEQETEVNVSDNQEKDSELQTDLELNKESKDPETKDTAMLAANKSEDIDEEEGPGNEEEEVDETEEGMEDGKVLDTKQYLF